jgi:hypothetical protein
VVRQEGQVTFHHTIKGAKTKITPKKRIVRNVMGSV